MYWVFSTWHPVFLAASRSVVTVVLYVCFPNWMSLAALALYLGYTTYRALITLILDPDLAPWRLLATLVLLPNLAVWRLISTLLLYLVITIWRTLVHTYSALGFCHLEVFVHTGNALVAWQPENSWPHWHWLYHGLTVWKSLTNYVYTWYMHQKHSNGSSAPEPHNPEDPDSQDHTDIAPMTAQIWRSCPCCLYSNLSLTDWQCLASSAQQQLGTVSRRSQDLQTQTHLQHVNWDFVRILAFLVLRKMLSICVFISEEHLVHNVCYNFRIKNQ